MTKEEGFSKLMGPTKNLTIFAKFKFIFFSNNLTVQHLFTYGYQLFCFKCLEVINCSSIISMNLLIKQHKLFKNVLLLKEQGQCIMK